MDYSHAILFAVVIIVIAINSYLAVSLIASGRKADQKDATSLWLLLAVIIGSTAGHVTWFLKLLNLLIIPLPYPFRVFFIRIAYAFLPIQYQSLTLLVGRLLKAPHINSLISKLILAINTFFVLYFTYTAFFENTLLNETERIYALNHAHLLNSPLEVRMMSYIALYLLPLTSIFCIWVLIKGMRQPQLPNIIKHHMNILIKYFIFPFLCIEALIAINRILQFNPVYLMYIVGSSILLTSAAIFYCLKILTPLRFLNLKPHIGSSTNGYFVMVFANIIAHMERSSSTQELTQMIQQFFKQSLAIPHDKVTAHILNHGIHHKKTTHKLERYMRTIAAHPNSKLCKYIKKHHVIVYDDLIFNRYYGNKNQGEENVITFLDTINADIFLPIYSKNNMIAAVIIERNTLQSKDYNNIHRNELLIFATYIANTLRTIQSNTVEQCSIAHQKTHNTLSRNTKS